MRETGHWKKTFHVPRFIFIKKIKGCVIEYPMHRMTDHP